MSPRTAIIGAGPAGCAAAHLLFHRGRRVVVFERAPAVGGRTTTWRGDGFVVDSGASFFTDFYPTLRRLADELGLQDEVQPIARSTALACDGRIAELTVGSVASFATYPFLGAAAKLKMALATAAATLRFRGLDLSRPETLAPLDDQSVHEDARRRVGEAAYQFVVRPGIEPFWYFSCDEASRALSLALLAHAATARFYTLGGGMDRLCHALVEGLEVRTGAAVDAVAWRPDGFEVRGSHGAEHFDEVVIATTADVAASLVRGAGDLPRGMRDFLASQRYAANVHAAFVVPRSAALAGRTALFPCGPKPSPLAAISFNGCKHQGAPPPGLDVVSVFLSSDESRRVLDQDDDALFAHAWAAARALYPALPARAEPFRLARRAHAIPVHAVGRYRQAAAIEAAQRGPLVFAGDYLTTATVDGALRSGEAAADALTR